jgi:hypothetical protein
MQNVIKLSQDDIITAIDFYLEEQGQAADVGTISFAFDGEGRVQATLEGTQSGLAEQFRAFAGGGIAAAIAQRDTVDAFGGQEIKKGEPCLWIQDEGITATHPVKWPEEFKKRYPFTDEQLAFLAKKLEKSGASTEASTAASILGGDDDGPVDRSSALEQGLEK